VYKRLELRGDLHRLIPAIASSRGFAVTELPVPHARRRFGSSRYHLLRHRGLLDIVALVAGNTTQSRPFHIFSEAAAFCWLLAAVALAGWVALTMYVPGDSLAYRLAGPLVGLLGIGAVFLGLMLPLIGFQLEITAGRLQDGRWRQGLLKRKLDAKVNESGKGVRTLLPERPGGCLAQKGPDPFSALDAKVGGYGPCRDSEREPPEPGSQTVLQPDAQPVSLLERAADRRLGRSISPPRRLPAVGGRLRGGQ
jgi:hypothetical protein